MAHVDVTLGRPTFQWDAETWLNTITSIISLECNYLSIPWITLVGFVSSAVFQKYSTRLEMILFTSLHLRNGATQNAAYIWIHL